MNANELADALDDVVANYIQMIADVDFSDVATMLRQQQAEINTLRNHGYKTQYELLRIEFLQQQAEIEALKQIIDANNLNQNIGQFVKPTNEPVAWMDKETGCFVYSQYDYEDLDEHGKDGLIPLYTHPVKEQDAIRYRWLRAEFEAGRETYLAEGMPSGERLDEYIDEQLRKAQEK